MADGHGLLGLEFAKGPFNFVAIPVFFLGAVWRSDLVGTRQNDHLLTCTGAHRPDRVTAVDTICSHCLQSLHSDELPPVLLRPRARCPSASPVSTRPNQSQERTQSALRWGVGASLPIRCLYIPALCAIMVKHTPTSHPDSSVDRLGDWPASQSDECRICALNAPARRRSLCTTRDYLLGVR